MTTEIDSAEFINKMAKIIDLPERIRWLKIECEIDKPVLVEIEYYPTKKEGE